MATDTGSRPSSSPSTAFRSRSSLIMMSPWASVAAEKMPSVGVYDHLCPIPEALKSSVTSKRRWGHPLRALTIRAPVPASAIHEYSVRTMLGSAGWRIQSRCAGMPRTPASAHSTWSASADGALCTNTIPRP